MTVEEQLDDMLIYLDDLIDIAESQQSARSLGKLCIDIARLYRALGIGSLLTRGDIDSYFKGLALSATTRKYYLDRARMESIADPALRSSLIDSFVDAVAIGKFRIAASIAAQSERQWLDGFEYEDDYCYARILYGLVSDKHPGREDLGALLDRYATALEGATDSRIKVCMALIEGSQDDFDESFSALTDAFEREMTAIADPALDSPRAMDFAFEPNRHVFVEGIAVLRLADREGLDTRGEFRFCPSIVRQSFFRTFEPNLFPYIST